MAPAQGWHAQIEKRKQFLARGYVVLVCFGAHDLVAQGETADIPWSVWGRVALRCQSQSSRPLSKGDGAGSDEAPHTTDCWHYYMYIRISLPLSLSLSLYVYICIHTYTYLCTSLSIHIYIHIYVCIYIYIYIYIHTYTYIHIHRERDVLLAVLLVLSLQPDGLTIHTQKWFLGAGFLGAPPISQFELFELILLLKLDKQLVVEQFEATVS